MRRRSAWLTALGALALGIGALVSACGTVPETGRSQLQLVSPAQEAEMGADAYKEILGKAKVSTDPNVNALVQRVGTRIAAATGRKDLAGSSRSSTTRRRRTRSRCPAARLPCTPASFR